MLFPYNPPLSALVMGALCCGGDLVSSSHRWRLRRISSLHSVLRIEVAFAQLLYTKTKNKTGRKEKDKKKRTTKKEKENERQKRKENERQKDKRKRKTQNKTQTWDGAWSGPHPHRPCPGNGLTRLTTGTVNLAICWYCRAVSR